MLQSLSQAKMMVSPQTDSTWGGERTGNPSLATACTSVATDFLPPPPSSVLLHPAAALLPWGQRPANPCPSRALRRIRLCPDRGRPTGILTLENTAGARPPESLPVAARPSVTPKISDPPRGPLPFAARWRQPPPVHGPDGSPPRTALCLPGVARTAKRPVWPAATDAHPLNKR